ncbi:MAG: hypothetical protein QXV35_00940 [Archaeoglobaceae archaeon]
MYSVFYYMGEAISTIIIAIAERLYPRPFFEEKIELNIYEERAMKDGNFAVVDTRYLPFRPRLLADGIKAEEKKERVYITWKELASDKFFEDIEKMFERLEKSK